MINKFTIKDFKSHSKTELDFANLTVLCGANGVGKSSVIHALLLLRESYIKKNNFDYLNLQGESVNIGTANDALHQYSGDDTISFKISTENGDLAYFFKTERYNLSKTFIDKIKVDDIANDDGNDVLKKESLFTSNFQFISAARLGPKSSYRKDDVVVGINNQISVNEGMAEYFIHFLQHNAKHTVLPKLRKNNHKNDLLSQVSAWEREISSGVSVVVRDQGQGYELYYSFDTVGDDTRNDKTNEFKANNVGFGLTYVMPIIVAILSAPEGALLFIENPEAHLHPNGQAKLIELICLAAQRGIQIVLETHSDHIINGILVQSKKFEDLKGEKGIDKSNISIYHFDKSEDGKSCVAKKIIVEEDGYIGYTPKGFFDQFTIDRKTLMGF